MSENMFEMSTAPLPAHANLRNVLKLHVKVGAGGEHIYIYIYIHTYIYTLDWRKPDKSKVMQESRHLEVRNIPVQFQGPSCHHPRDKKYISKFSGLMNDT